MGCASGTAALFEVWSDRGDLSMPTNVVRKIADSRKPERAATRSSEGVRIAVLTAGRVAIRIQLLDTETATRIWQALPLHSTAETWGACVHFDTPLEAGRDRSAKIKGAAGEIYFWIEDDHIVVPFGPTPISKPGEIRLPSPCNVWARALDDVTALAVVTAGEKVSLVVA